MINLLGRTKDQDEQIFINRATGPYAWAYWTMLVSGLVLPLTLLIRKLASKFWYLLLVAIGMKIGMYFELFVILMSSNRDYLDENGNGKFTDSFYLDFGLILLQGLIITLLILGIFEIIKKGKLRETS